MTPTNRICTGRFKSRDRRPNDGVNRLTKVPLMPKTLGLPYSPDNTVRLFGRWLRAVLQQDLLALFPPAYFPRHLATGKPALYGEQRQKARHDFHWPVNATIRGTNRLIFCMCGERLIEGRLRSAQHQPRRSHLSWRQESLIMWIIVVVIIVLGAGTMTYRAATDHTEPKTVTPKAISLVDPTRPSG